MEAEGLGLNRRTIITLVALAVAIPLHWYLNLPGPIPEPWGMPRWRWELASLFGALSMVLPGVIVGLAAGRHGLLLGAIVGYAGHLLGAPGIELSDRNSSKVAAQILSWALAPMAHAVLSAAGGGVGQLLRGPQLNR